MAEDPIAQGEIAALTKRFEAFATTVTDQLGEIEKTQRIHGLAIAGLDAKLDDFIAEQRTANAKILEMLAVLVPKQV